MAPTLPRRLYQAVLRLLRPLEAATRRLVIVAARDLTVELAPPRSRKPRPKPKSIFVRNGVGTGLVLPRGVPLPRPARRTWSLPMADPLKRLSFGGPRRRTTPPHKAPRILFLDGPYRPLPPPPGADDPIDATRLALRVAGIGRALADMPREARRFARWKARRDRALAQGRRHRLSPLRPGRAPGLSGATSRRPTHEIHDILKNLQYFAYEALAPDTS